MVKYYRPQKFLGLFAPTLRVTDSLPLFSCEVWLREAKYLKSKIKMRVRYSYIPRNVIEWGYLFRIMKLLLSDYAHLLSNVKCYGWSGGIVFGGTTDGDNSRILGPRGLSMAL